MVSIGPAPAYLADRSVSLQQKVLTLSAGSGRRSAPSIRATALVFEDAASLELLRELEKIAPSDAPVVIIGETGTGKELVARFIHEHSARARGPFMAVNCGALVDSLVEAELFGYEKGAFTGAVQTQPGWFEAAQSGTLFLDEIGDLPLNLQVKLLRVLQEREVVRLGSRRSIAVDARIVAATNIDLADAVAAGHFREDLFFRLNVAGIHLRALRDRPGDILPLARHFLGAYGARLDRSGMGFSPSAEALLLSHSWPGNIRELENVVHYALLIAQDGVIKADDLRLKMPSVPGGQEGDLEVQLHAMIGRHIDRGTPRLFDRIVMGSIQAAFEAAGGNQIKTAEALGISRNVLRTYLGRMGVIAPRRSA